MRPGCWSRAAGTAPRPATWCRPPTPATTKPSRRCAKRCAGPRPASTTRRPWPCSTPCSTMLPAGDRRWLQVLDVMPLTPDWVVDHRADANADVGVRAMRRADQVLERSADAAHRAAVKFSLGSLLAWGLCELEAGRELVTRARDLFAEAGDERSVLVATNELGYHAAHGRRRRSPRAAGPGGAGRGRGRQDPVLQLQALCSLAWALDLSGRARGITGRHRAGRRGGPAGGQDLSPVLPARHASFRRSISSGRPGTRPNWKPPRRSHPAYRDTLLLDFTAQMAWQAGDLQPRSPPTAIRWPGTAGVSSRRAFGAAMAVMPLAELGRHRRRPPSSRPPRPPFTGPDYWVLSRLIDWSGAVAVGLAGDRAGRAAATWPAQPEDAIDHSYWTWGRWMVVDLAEAAAYRGRPGPASRQPAELLRPRSLAPGRSVARRGARAFVFGRHSRWCAARPQDADRVARARPPPPSGRRAGLFIEGRSLALLGTALVRQDRTVAPSRPWRRRRSVPGVRRGGAPRAGAWRRLASLGTRGRRKRADLVGPGSLSAREREVAGPGSPRALGPGDRRTPVHRASAPSRPTSPTSTPSWAWPPRSSWCAACRVRYLTDDVGTRRSRTSVSTVRTSIDFRTCPEVGAAALSTVNVQKRRCLP